MTVNHMVPYNVSGGTYGYGIYLEGGSANPKVTVENSTIDHNQTGVWVGSNSTSSELTAIIERNLISSSVDGVDVESGATVTISSNTIDQNGAIGIALSGSTGSVTSNTIVGGQYGVSSGNAGFAIMSNKIYNASLYGIDLDIAVVEANVTGNILTKIGEIGIFVCNSTGSPNKVHTNTFVDTPVGYEAASGFPTSGNTFIGVGTDAVEPCT